MRSRRDRPFWYLRRKPDELQSAVDEELRVHLEMHLAQIEGVKAAPGYPTISRAR